MDFYRRRLAHALWTWREDAGTNSYHRRKRHKKDRTGGRAEKSRARRLERREIADQREAAFHPAEIRLAMIESITILK